MDLIESKPEQPETPIDEKTEEEKYGYTAAAFHIRDLMTQSA
jgi:hypothetical protein